MSFQNPVYKNNNNHPKLPYNKSERLGEFLGFVPDQLANDLYNTYNVVVYTTLESLESYLKTLDGLSEIQIKEQLQRFDEKVEQILDKNFSGFEKYFYDNIFGVMIEGHIPLEHYEGLDLDVTEEQEDVVDRALEKSRRVVLA
ncbi:hypothetical protein INT45_009459 [Circinella minor]|uniref:Uncharacterized protein n=1 Tax=Circinella minor TaxID=1195481 RepID=A0A8H7S654_9FUNG|nr:hypothetical protein INT45_009459 [Circinella minor]